MAHLVHVRRLLFEGWDAEAVAAYTTAPLPYVEGVRDGKVVPSFPWPNGRRGPLKDVLAPITPMVEGDL